MNGALHLQRAIAGEKHNIGVGIDTADIASPRESQDR